MIRQCNSLDEFNLGGGGGGVGFTSDGADIKRQVMMTRREKSMKAWVIN